MLRPVRLPGSFAVLVEVFRPCFTAPSFATFVVLVTGMISQTGRATVCGMLTAAGLARRWRHERAHWFFSRAVWSVDRVGLKLLSVIVDRVLGPEEPVRVAVDDTLFRRAGRKTHGTAWHRDPTSASPGAASAWGHTWVVAGVLITLPFATRPVCLPILARLWNPRAEQAPSKPALARELITQIAGAYPQRRVHVVADALYGTRYWRGMPPTVTVTVRPRSNAAFYAVHTPQPGVGRPRYKGPKIGTPTAIAATGPWRTGTVTRYGRTAAIDICERRCLWPGVLRDQHIRLICVREPTVTRSRNHDVALVTTDLDSPAELLIERYAARWAIEVTFHDAKHLAGVGHAENRVTHAVERTVPFGLITYSLTTVWYTLAGHNPSDVQQRRQAAPWYTSKTEPAYQDMLVKLRRLIIAAQFQPETQRTPTPQETLAIHQAWAEAAT
ncbi:IS701 family transposase [Bounagaea algeriensis]